MTKKTTARKGTKTKRLTVAQRRAILVNHGWVQTPPHPHIFWRGTPSMQRVRVETGEVSDNGGETYTKLTDREFRAFVRKHAPTARKGKTAKRLTLEGVRKLAVDGINHALKAIRDTDRKAASLDALNELRADVLKLHDFNNRNADAVRELRRDVKALDGNVNTLTGITDADRRELRGVSELVFSKPAPATPAVDVAALCKRHGLKEWGSAYAMGGDGCRSMIVWACGRWWHYPLDDCDSDDSGSIDTLAAALDKYCPVKPEYAVPPGTPCFDDAPYGEAERRADAVAEGWGLAGHMQNIYYPNGGGASYDMASPAASAHGRIRDPLGDWKDATPAEFRAHLRKYAVKRNGPASLDLSQSKAWREAEAAVADKVAAIRRMNPPSGLVMEAPPRDPDATPDERRAELERRGLKNIHDFASERYNHGGTRECPAAYTGGDVYGKDLRCIKTRTLAEFCAALDAVGLVAKAATPAERAALAEKWGLREHSRGLTASATSGYLRVYDASGYWWVEKADGANVVSGDTTTLADLEAVFRERLPYTREWREEVAREAGYEQSPADNYQVWYAPGDGAQVHVAGFHSGNVNNVLPDRAAWLAFIREHTPKPAPVDALEVANARIAELEAQLVAVWKAAGVA